ncbi:molecular chaperone SurA [Pusillimonas sp. ANT_WB101]|nr:peptidylprolyl isomerase [Pusillimonas sp. ANT_WB101]KAA0890268.1 molecular chaperone SurA [Pusillimonas sp. ANT_WB101]
MHRLPAKRWIVSFLVALAGAILLPGTSLLAKPATSSAKSPAEPAAKPAGAQFVDGIAAVVNTNVITLQQVNADMQTARQQLQHQNIPIPDEATLQKQVLQRMITQELQRQEAERLGIRVSEAQLAQAVQAVAGRNKLTEAQLRREIEKSGVSWDHYLDSVRTEVRMDMLRQRAVDSTVTISDGEIDSFLKNQDRQAGRTPQQSRQQSVAPSRASAQSGPQMLGIAQILVAVPEGATASQVESLRQKAEGLLARVRSGADFAGVAAASSDGPQALEGGNLGVRPVDGWPDLFVQATQSLKAGEVGKVVRSANGFHILKVTAKGAASAQPQARPAAPPTLADASPTPQQQGPMIVTQTHARHILIKISKVMSDQAAHDRVEQLRQRILNGESFEDLAKRYSEDASAPQGGDLGWLTPGETVPAFEQAMNALQPGQVSEPVRSQFGWHLIQVIERRNKDMGDEFRRMEARKTLFERRIEPAYEEWLSQLRGHAYIDNRLDPESSSGRR